MGLLREDKALTNRFLRSHASVESIRMQIEGHTTIREKVSTSVVKTIMKELMESQNAIIFIDELRRLHPAAEP